MAEQDNLDPGARMDAANLYTETVVTDRKVGTIRVLAPITADGNPDTTRPALFLGEAQIMTQMGPLPISFEIPVATLSEAVENYGEAAAKGIEQTMERLRALRREAASQIVTPDMPGFQAPPSGGIAMP